MGSRAGDVVAVTALRTGAALGAGPRVEAVDDAGAGADDEEGGVLAEVCSAGATCGRDDVQPVSVRVTAASAALVGIRQRARPVADVTISLWARHMTNA
jgi:hypothetical protein